MNILTVVIPVKDSEKTLEQTLHSIVAQSVIAHNAIVVDDGSETEACHLLVQKYEKQYPGMFSYVRIPHGGPGRARNYGLSMAETEYVTFLDGDDHWGVRMVEELVRMAASGADMLFTRPVCRNEATGKQSLFMDDGLYTEVFFDEAVFAPEERPGIYGLQVNAARIALRREWLAEIGYAFSENCRWEDVVPFYQAISAARTCVGTCKTGFVYRTGRVGQATRAADTVRLDAVPVFAQAMRCVNENYRPELGAAFYGMMCEFLCWCTLNTPVEYRKQMTDSVAELIVSAPGVMVRDYLQQGAKPKQLAFLVLLLAPGLRKFLWEDGVIQKARRLRRR